VIAVIGTNVWISALQFAKRRGTPTLAREKAMSEEVIAQLRYPADMHHTWPDNRGPFCVERLLEPEAREKCFAGHNGTFRRHRRDSTALEIGLRLRRFHSEADTEDQVGSVEARRQGREPLNAYDGPPCCAINLN
jgi:hypothetical protein